MPVMVDRSRLLDRLSRPQEDRVTTIIAPAGYGKTTLAEQWAQTTQHPVARLAVSPSRTSVEGLFEDILGVLDVGEEPPADPGVPSANVPQVAAVIVAMNAIVATRGALTVILDDFEHVVAPATLKAVDALIASMPRGAHLMVLSRSIPRLTLARLRAIGKLNKITAADLRFTLDEATAALDGMALTSYQVRRVLDRTEGWITGIRQVRHALAQAEPEGSIDDLIDALTRDYWLRRYFREEVLDRLPEALREFVLITSAFPSLDPELCAATLEIDDAEAQVHDLHSRGDFITLPAQAGGDVRYLRMFADSMASIAISDLGIERLRDVWGRAATYLADNDRPGDALELAARVQNWDAAADYARRYVRAAEDREWVGTTLERLRRLPRRILVECDELAFAYIRACNFTGNFSAGRQVLDAVLPRWLASDDPTVRRYAASAQTTILGLAGDTDGALRKLHEVLEIDAPADSLEHLHAWSVISHLEFLRGDVDAAEYAYQQAARCQAELGRPSYFWDMVTRPERANQMAMRGDLHSAERMYVSQLRHSTEVYRAPMGKLDMRLALIYLEWDLLDQALEAIGRIQRGHGVFPYDVWRPEAGIAASRVYWASGRREEAERAMNEALALLRERGGALHWRRAQAIQATYWLASGQKERAQDWAAINRYNQPDPVRQFGDFDPRIALIQVFLDDGTWKSAAEIAQQGVAESPRSTLAASRVQFLVWQAVALAMGGELDRSDEALREALEIGARGTFIASFRPPGHDLSLQLGRIHQTARPEIKAYIDRIMARGQSVVPPPRHEVVPVDAELDSIPCDLTPREREVLALVQRGSINREIADQLYITERTVKKHIANLCRKLDAPNRTAAVVRAYELGLLD